MKRNSAKFKGMFFVFWAGGRGDVYSGETYSHPEIRIYQVSSYLPEICSPDSVIDFLGQNDSKRGMHIYQTYSLRAEISFNNYHAADAYRILSAIGMRDKYEYPVSILALARTLFRLGMDRRVLRDVRDERGRTDRKFVPARFRNSAQLWYEAATKGMELKRKTA